MNEIKGIVIDSYDYKENSKIVKLYTEYGYDSVKVLGCKNSKKGMLMVITTLNEVSYVKTNAKLPTLTEFKLLNSLYQLTNSLDGINILSILVKIIKNIPNETNHIKTYDYISNTLKQLSSNKYDKKKILCIFLIKMLYIYGVNPNLKECNKCKNTNNLIFIHNEGISLCMNCTNIKNNNHHIWYDYYYKKKNIEDYIECDYNKLLDEIIAYYKYHTNIL